MFGGAGFEGEPGSLGVGLGRGLMFEHAAEVDEVLLCGGAFFEFSFAPLSDEFLGGEGWLGHNLVVIYLLI